MNQDLIDKYVDLKANIKELEDRVKELKEKTKPVEKQVLSEFETDGIQSIKDTSGRTIYLQSQLWAGRDPDVGEEAFIMSLRENGYDDLVQEKVNTQTLSAVMREQAGDYMNLEDVAVPYGVRLTERVSVRVRGL